MKKENNMRIRYKLDKERQNSRVVYSILKFRLNLEFVRDHRRVVMVDNTFGSFRNTTQAFTNIPNYGYFPKWKDGLIFKVKYIRAGKDNGIPSDMNCAIPRNWWAYNRGEITIIKRGEKKT